MLEPALAIAALVAVATIVGIAWRWATGRVQRQGGAGLTLPAGIVPGTAATLVQFSTPVCAPCVPTRALLSGIAGERAGIEHVELDVLENHELASRLRVLQTPTTIILDGSGAIRARIGGTPRDAVLRAELDRILAA